MNYTSITSILQALNKDKIIETEESVVISVSTEASEQICPRCGAKTKYVHGYRIQMIKESIYHGKSVFIRLRKRRYKCSCGKTFFEKYDFISRYKRFTNAFRFDLLNALKSSASLKQIAKDYNVSPPTVQRMLNCCPSMHPVELPDKLGIDEFKGNTGGEKYNCILTDLTTGKVFDILPSRSKSHLINYFKRFKNRDKVRFFVMDMTNNYKSIAYLFPNAKVIADRYHYVRQVYWALDNVRKRIQKNMYPWKRIYFKHSRNLLFAEYSNLNEGQQQQLRVMLSQSEDLRTAWELKEAFIHFRRANTKERAEQELHSWLLTAEESGLIEFKTATIAFHNWFRYIVNSVEYNISNAITEGKNNKIKVLKRNAYGFRNFFNFRKRILLTC